MSDHPDQLYQLLQQQRHRHRTSDAASYDGPGACAASEMEDDEQSIIDVFEFDDTAQDRWLCSIGSRRNSIDNKIEDLDAWLHSETLESDTSQLENENKLLEGSRRSFDTRTFVRIKRKSGRLSFEGTEASVLPETKSFSLSNVWKNQAIPESPTQNVQNEKEQNSNSESRDIPMMLRPKTNQVLAAIMSESPSSISSQTSMEAFMNLACSKEGLNSLLSDISDPDVSSILMNISQPSLLYSSIISDSKGDESEQAAEVNSLIDSQILTDSMMEASMFKEVQDTTLLENFLKDNNDSTFLEDKTFTFENAEGNETFTASENGKINYTISPIHKNEMNLTKTLSPESNTLNSTKNITNTSNSLNSTKTLSSKENSMNTTQIIANPCSSLNTTNTISPKINSLNSTQTIIRSPALLNSTQTIIKTPTLLNSTQTIIKSPTLLNSTQTIIKTPTLLNSTQTIIKTPTLLNSTQTIIKTPTLLNSTQTIIKTPGLNSTQTLNCDESEIIKDKDILSATHTMNSEEKTDLTFEIHPRLSPNQKPLDVIFQTSDLLSAQSNELIENGENSFNATLNAASSLRAELLQEVKRSSGNKYDSTFTNDQLQNIETNFDVTYDRSNINKPFSIAQNNDATYIQMSKLDQPESQSYKKSLNDTYNSMQSNAKFDNATELNQISSQKKNNPRESHGNLLEHNRFNTFRKESKTFKNLPRAPSLIENHFNKPKSVVSSQLPPPNTNNDDKIYQQRFNTFSKKSNIFTENQLNNNKPTEKFVQRRQLQPPRQLTKLPQLFQKSNPNLGSSSKLLGKLASEPNVGFNKGSQPNISNSNMPTLARFKSEQRLMQVKYNSEFSSGDGTSRSMESIVSTSSAHSAPDFDDKSSICSDNSRASYTIKPRNLETLKKLANEERIGGKFGGSTPKVKGHHVLENTWVEEKNLPSPILKNGSSKGVTTSESSGSISTSPTDSSEFTAKTSSPISPNGSEQTIHTLGNGYNGSEATKENNQATENVKPKQIKAPTSVSNTMYTTKLRRPSNWTGTTNKPNCAVSGIPRPASRIPAPKFARPNAK